MFLFDVERQCHDEYFCYTRQYIFLKNEKCSFVCFDTLPLLNLPANMQIMGNAEDFNRLRLIQKAMKDADYLHPWEWRVDIILPNGMSIPEHTELFRKIGGGSGSDADTSFFDLYAKDVSFGPVTIENEPVKAGAITFTYPTASAPVSITMTMRDRKDRVVYDWLKALAKKVLNDDGTVNLPSTYLIQMRLINLSDSTTTDEWLVYPTDMGEITLSVDTEGLTEFPVKFMQFRSLG